MFRCIAAVAPIFSMSAKASARRADDPREAQTETSDVDAFFQIYDAARGQPDNRRALRETLEARNADEFLAASGLRPQSGPAGE